MDFVICTRNIENGQFGTEPGKTSFLCFPDNCLPDPSYIQPNRQQWVKKLLAELPTPSDHILIFVHGYNTTQKMMMERHRLLEKGLKTNGFKGVVVSFDWPTEGKALSYWEDRSDAKKTALELVSGGISLVCQQQQPQCQVNVHILAHSMGAFVVREAFDDADDRHSLATNWKVSQLMLIGADISGDSLTVGNSTTESLYRHCVRLTNYSNHNDHALAISAAKRLGIAPRVGRQGLPENVPAQAVNVDCSDYWESIPEQKTCAGGGYWDHSWYFCDPIMMTDLSYTIRGIDRDRIPTRTLSNDGKRVLRTPPNKK